MLTYAAFFLVASTALAAEPTGVPKEALAELEYRVGKWKSTGFVDGAEQAKPDSVGLEATKWVQGKYCIQITTSLIGNGIDIGPSGIVGWDADKRQLVEHWYSSDGGYASFRYTGLKFFR